MATFKAIVKSKRKDGFYPVYIRVTQRAKLAYMPTDKFVTDKGLSRTGEIEDPYVLQYCTAKIIGYVEQLNRQDIDHWSVRDVVRFLQTGESDISFSQYARSYIHKMFQRGQERNSQTYENALNHLERFAGTKSVMFSAMTSTFVNEWIESLSQTRRAKEHYPICMRQVFKTAMNEYNDYDKGVLRIKTNPWPKVKIPSADTPQKIAITAQQARAFFSAPLPESKLKEPLPELGRDLAMMVLCLAGINTIDIFNLKKSDYHDGIIHYQRAKTRKARADNAYIEMRVPPLLYPIFEKYKTADDDEFLFSFHKRYHTSDSFGSNVNFGIKQICDTLGIHGKDRYCVYTWRHTWATVAQNDCGATLEEVGFALNHSQRSTRVTRGYVKIDFSPAWQLNEKVVDYIFFREDETQTMLPADPESRLFRFSAKHMIAAAAYFRGKMLGEVHDTGFNNIDEVIRALAPSVPDDVPERSMVQFKIEIVDKGLTQIYERMKGKGI
jgi:integrase